MTGVTITWLTKVINIDKDYLIPTTNPDIFNLDSNQFRLDLKGLEAGVDGMTYLDTHQHNTQVPLGGVTYARVIEIINDYTITFEDGQYAVNLIGSNNNIADVTNVNQVGIRANNAAGLVVVDTGSGVTEQDKLDIADRVWDEDNSEHLLPNSTGYNLASITGATDGGFSGDTTAIAIAVWEELTSSHSTSGSFGKLLTDLIIKADLHQHTLNVNTDLLNNKPNNP